MDLETYYCVFSHLWGRQNHDKLPPIFVINIYQLFDKYLVKS